MSIDFSKLNGECLKVMMLAQESARMRKVESIYVGDLLIGLLSIKGEVYNFLSKYKITKASVNNRLVKGTSKEQLVELPLSEEAKKVLEEAENTAFKRQIEEVDIFYALCNTWFCLDLLESLNLNVKGIETHFEQVIYKKNNTHLNFERSIQNNNLFYNESEEINKEISRRDYFAAAAINGMLSNPTTELSDETMLSYAIELADKLIEELDKEN